MNNQGNCKMQQSVSLQQNEIMSMVVNASGDTNWEIQSKEQLTLEEVENINQQHAMNLNKNELYRYIFSKKNSQNAIHKVKITALPEYNKITAEAEEITISFVDLISRQQMTNKLAELEW